ncbi:MAG: hypothetical protein N2746_07925 [Deltaproteobacteria bacterium]|nr:hypothetical protein [Deltaproteobacteria bacterium]
MANQKCKRSQQRKAKCVKCLSLVNELIKQGDISEDELERLNRIKKSLEKGSVISEAQVNYIYELWGRYQ